MQIKVKNIHKVYEQDIKKVEIEISGQPVGKGGYVLLVTVTPIHHRKQKIMKVVFKRRMGKMKEMKLEPISKFCHIEMIAWMDIPKSWPKVKRLEAEYGAILPASKPDVDNILKALWMGLRALCIILMHR